MKRKYDKARSLNDREQAREKLSVWYGSRSNYYHGFREVVINNPIDEISNNFESGNIYITLHDDKRTITVKDTGRGMPLNLKDDEDTPYWYLFLQKMFGSGKYDLEDQDNSGTNGLGGTVLNYTSDFYDVTSCFDGDIWHIRFEDGGILKTPLENLGKTEEHGTTITFKLEEACYSEETVYDVEMLKDIIDKACSVSPKVHVYFEHNGEKAYFHYDNPLEDYYLKYIDKEENMFKLEYKEFDDSNETSKVQCVLSKSFKPVQLSFLNKNNLIQGGKIDEGVTDGVKTFINKYGKENNLFDKTIKQVRLEDVEQSISYMITYNSTRVEYQSQTKFSTDKQLYKKVTKNYILEQLELISLVEKDKFMQLVKHVIEVAKMNSKFKEKKEVVSGKQQIRVSSKKLSDCSSKNPEERELTVVEGDSAGGSAKNAGNKKFQAVLSTRGKILNVIKATQDTVLKNEEFKIFAQAIGIGLLEDFDPKKLRYHKIIIMTDADVDGLHIRCLWTCFCWKYYRELVEQGYLYISQPPLYMIKTKDKKEHYCYSDKELEDKLKELGVSEKDVEIQRFKGLGEMSPEQMRETTMSPDTRLLYQVKVEDVEKFETTLDELMGDKVEPRKNFYRENSEKAHIIN